MTESNSKPRIWNRIFKRTNYTPLPSDSKVEDSRVFKTVSTSVSQDQRYFIPPPVPQKYSAVPSYSQNTTTYSQQTTTDSEKYTEPTIDQKEIFPAGVHSVELEQLRKTYKHHLEEYNSAQISILHCGFFILYFLYSDPYLIMKALLFGVVVAYVAYIQSLKITNWMKQFMEKPTVTVQESLSSN